MNKLSVQIQDGTRDDAWDLVEQASPRVLKLLDTAFGRWDRVLRWQRNRAPGDSVVVLRYVKSDHTADLPAQTTWLIQQARSAQALGVEGIVLEIPINEAYQTGDALSQLAAASLASIDAVAKAGFGVAVGNFSVGNPPRLLGARDGQGTVASDLDWPRFVPALRATRAAMARHGVGGYLSLHEYGLPDTWQDPWLLTRYRKVWQELPEGARLPILITEFGIDKGLLGSALGGWRDPYFHLAADEYARLCRWYRDAVAGDAYVHGVTLFVAGGYPGAPPRGWESFEVAGEDTILQVMREVIDGPALWFPPLTSDDRATPIADPATSSGEVDALDYVAIVREAAERHGVPVEMLDRLARQESSYDEDVIFGRRDSPAGARGLMQIIPAYHPTVDPLDPRAAADYCAAWLAREAAAYGHDWTRAVIAWNGGHGAVQAWEAGTPHSETLAYLNAVIGATPMGDLCIAQFGGELDSQGFGTATVASACGPIAAAGLAASLGIAISAADALSLAASHGWDPDHGMSGTGGNGPANFAALCAGIGLSVSGIGRDAVIGALRKGQKVVISTPAHYYLAQRASRVDDDLFVGNTGRARRGGDAWMSLEAIESLDAGINGLFVGEQLDHIALEATAMTPDGLIDAIDREISALVEHSASRDGAIRIRELLRSLRTHITKENT